jgi:transposase
MNRRFELTDQEWERLAPLLPSTKPKRGGRWRDHRQVLNGILFQTRTGVPWRDLPTGMGPGRRSTETLYKDSRAGRPTGPGHRSRLPCAPKPTRPASWTGTPRSTPASSALTSTPPGPAKGDRADPGKPPAGAGPVAGGLTTKLHTICDGRGRNLATRLTPGQDADTSELVGLVDQVRVARPGGRGRPRIRPDHLTGDKAYSSRANRAALRARHIRHTIPERDDQKTNCARRGPRGGRPPAFDRVHYRNRNQVERLMNRRKQFRAVATRFDKLADRYQATITIADILIWLRARPDRSRGDPRNTP